MKGDSAHIIGWSAYLCCSWMWCIGLFYPVLLYRDFGIASWFIFTIPNVVGASLVPWFIKNAQSSKDFVRHHSLACKLFSAVTILFNTYFLSWTMVSFDLSVPTILFVILISFFVFLICRTRLLAISLTVFLISLCALLLIFLLTQGTGLTIARESKFGISEALGLVPVFLIGFLFCPYLDLTFHRVVKESQHSQTKLIYIIAFIIFFLSFLMLGVKYYPLISHVLIGVNEQPKTSVFLAVCSYIIIQSSFTSIVHLNELLEQKLPKFAWVLLICILVCVFVCAVGVNGEITLLGRTMHLREILYRGFLSVYGLLAPVYIWIFALFKFDKSQPYIMDERRWFIWLIAVLLALPFYIAGFYGSSRLSMYILPIGVLLALLTPMIVQLTLRFFLGTKSDK